MDPGVIATLERGLGGRSGDPRELDNSLNCPYGLSPMGFTFVNCPNLESRAKVVDLRSDRRAKRLHGWGGCQGGVPRRFIDGRRH